VLEPWSPASLVSSAHRTVGVRLGFDLEPLIPDPAPAFADPDGALHPALLEGLVALPLQSYPTQAARSALVSQVLSAPERPDPDNPRDPFVAIYRHAVSKDMEPEVTGNLALLLIRGKITQIQRQHRPRLPDPAEALLDPDNDPWRHRRARLHGSDWESLWEEVNAAAEQCGDSAVFAFERVNLLAGRQWLSMYRSWWQVAALLSGDELCPRDLSVVQRIEDGLHTMRQNCSVHLGLSEPEPTSAALLSAAIDLGIRHEAAFIEATGARPSEGPISARWLLNQQLRSLRHITLATREHSLHLHELMRATDIARVAVQIAYRTALIEMWLADVRGKSTVAIEDSLVGLADPEHSSTLGAGLGRVLGAVLMRRLRSGRETGSLPLAERALKLAPEELAVRIAWNDLRYKHRAGWDSTLLSSLRAEHERWESLPVLIMGSRVAMELGDKGRARWFRDQLIPRALTLPGFGPWALLVMECLGAPSTPPTNELLENLDDYAEDLTCEPDAATWALFGTSDTQPLNDAFTDLHRAVKERLLDIDDANNLVPTQLDGARKKPQRSAWQQLVNKTMPASDSAKFPGATWNRVQEIRAAAPDLRQPPVAAKIRQLQELLSRAADLLTTHSSEMNDEHTQDESSETSTRIVAEVTAGCEPLSQLILQIGDYLRAPDETNAEQLALWLDQQMDPLRVATQEPRAMALNAELDRLSALARAQDSHQALERAALLRANIARARTDEDSDARFADIDRSLTELSIDLHRDDSAQPSEPTPEPVGTMQLHPDFQRFSRDELGMLPDALRRALEMVRLFNLSGGRRDRKRLKGKKVRDLFELRHRTAHTGGLRVFYERNGRGWMALAAMSKYDDRQQRDAIERVRLHFQTV